MENSHSELVKLWLTGKSFQARKVQEELDRRISHGASRDYQTDDQYKLAAVANVVAQCGFSFGMVAEAEQFVDAVEEGMADVPCPSEQDLLASVQDINRELTKLLVKQNTHILGLKNMVDTLLGENSEMRFRLEGLDK